MGSWSKGGGVLGLLVKLGPGLWLQSPVGPRDGVGLLVLVGEAVS